MQFHACQTECNFYLQPCVHCNLLASVCLDHVWTSRSVANLDTNLPTTLFDVAEYDKRSMFLATKAVFSFSCACYYWMCPHQASWIAAVELNRTRDLFTGLRCRPQQKHVSWALAKPVSAGVYIVGYLSTCGANSSTFHNHYIHVPNSSFNFCNDSRTSPLGHLWDYSQCPDTTFKKNFIFFYKILSKMRTPL